MEDENSKKVAVTSAESAECNSTIHAQSICKNPELVPFPIRCWLRTSQPPSPRVVSGGGRSPVHGGAG